MPTGRIKQDRQALLARIQEEAHMVADVGFWPAPKGYTLYWAVNLVNLKIYIGITNDFQGRVAEHKNAAANGSPLPLHRAMRKYGANSFQFVPIEGFSDEASMARAEIETIAKYHAQDRDVGYNIADGGTGLGSRGAREVHSCPEFRKRFLASYPARAIKAAKTRRRNQAFRNATPGGLLPFDGD